MQLKILLPTEVLFAGPVSKVIAEGPQGMFTLLPRHIDFVTPLVPGIFSFDSEQKTIFAAVDTGSLVKFQNRVLVSTRNAIIGPDLGVLEKTVREQFLNFDDKERKARSAAARLEAGFIRKFLNLEQ